MVGNNTNEAPDEVCEIKSEPEDDDYETPAAKVRKIEVVPFDREKFDNLSDFKIRTMSSVIRCHRMMLAWQSAPFHKMFEDGAKDSVKIMDFDHATVEAFVDFLYKGRLANPARHTTDLLDMAHKYQVEPMKEACAGYLSRHLTKDNAADLWVRSVTYQLADLTASVHAFLAKNWSRRHQCVGVDDVIKSYPGYVLDLLSFVAKKMSSCATCQKS